MSLSLRFAAGSHKGMIREGNEDSGYAGPRLLAIADGMGGQAAGEVASSEVISTLVTLDDDVPGSDILTSLGDAVQRANDQLRHDGRGGPAAGGHGHHAHRPAVDRPAARPGAHRRLAAATCCATASLSQITQDHTWVQRLVDEGRITEEEAGTHPQRSLLMRALDGRGQVEPDLSIREVRAGDRYLICSDGLSGVVSHQTLEETLAGYQAPYETVQELIQLALRGGGPDNITCIVADVLDTDDGDTLAAQHNEHPVVVGAVAEHPHAAQRPAPPADPGRPRRRARPQRPQQPPAPDGAFGPPDSGDPAPGGGPLGSFGRPTTAARQAAAAAQVAQAHRCRPCVVLAVVGGGLYAGYRWTQTQYYVGANGDHVAVYQGIDQKPAGPEPVQGAPGPHRHPAQVPPDLPARPGRGHHRGRAASARPTTRPTSWHEQAVRLQDGRRAPRRKAGTSGASGDAARSAERQARRRAAAKPRRLGGPTRARSGHRQPTPDAASPGPTLSAEQQKLAQQCGTRPAVARSRRGGPAVSSASNTTTITVRRRAQPP